MGMGWTGRERAASQRELDVLRQRVDQMDAQGTRGVGVIQSQLGDLIRDFAKMEARLDGHEQLHEGERKDRAANRRWLTGTCIAALVLLVAILGLAVTIVGKTH